MPKKEKPIHAIQVGKQLSLPQPYQEDIKLAFGKVYDSWEGIPEEILKTVTHASDTTLLMRREAFAEITSEMSQLEILDLARSLVPLDKLPNVKYPFVFFPCDTYVKGGFAYCNAKYGK